LSNGTSQSRVARFDGPERSPEPDVPEAGLDGIFEALLRCKKYLPQTAVSKLAELWDLDTALAFAFLLALWAGLQFTPIGWLGDLALVAYGFYGFASDLGALIAAALQAMDAKNEAEMEAAAKAMAAGFTDTVISVVAGLLGGALFTRFRRLVKVVRAKLLPGRFKTPEGGKITWGERWAGRTSGVALEKGTVEVKKRAKNWRNALNWGLPAIGIAALAAGAYAVATTSGKKEGAS